jgi:hypothetical protein
MGGHHRVGQGEENGGGVVGGRRERHRQGEQVEEEGRDGGVRGGGGGLDGLGGVAYSGWRGRHRWRCEGVGKVERPDELGVEEAPGAEVRLHYHKPWGGGGEGALRVVGEHDEAAQWAVINGVRGGGGPFVAAEGEGAEGM